MEKDEKAVDSKRLAEILNVSYGSINGKAQSGEIPGFKIGKRWRFFPSEVIAHLRGVEEEASRDIFRQSPRSAAGHRAAATRKRLAAERARKGL